MCTPLNLIETPGDEWHAHLHLIETPGDEWHAHLSPDRNTW